MFKSREEFRAAAEELNQLSDRQARGEISEKELLDRWKTFVRKATLYLAQLKQEASKNTN